MMKTTKRPVSRRKDNVIPFTLSTHTRRSRRPTFGMHDEQIVGGKVVPFPGCGLDNGGPVTRGDGLALPPLLDTLVTHTSVSSHFGGGIPAAEKFSNGFHESLISGDQLSRQVVAIVPVTAGEAHRTIHPVGRAKTPVQFNKELALRLKSARVAAGYDTMPPFAKALGIELERYKKWESGRTPFQHEYLAAICELTGKDANYFYGIQPKEQQIRRTGTS